MRIRVGYPSVEGRSCCGGRVCRRAIGDGVPLAPPLCPFGGRWPQPPQPPRPLLREAYRPLCPILTAAAVLAGPMSGIPRDSNATTFAWKRTTCIVSLHPCIPASLRPCVTFGTDSFFFSSSSVCPPLPLEGDHTLPRVLRSHTGPGSQTAS